MLSITLPIYWQQTSSKQVLLSLNWYRNIHFHVKNKFKQEFHELVGKQLEGQDQIPSPFTLHIKLYYKNSNCDLDNVAPLISKVTLDALQEYGIITNDNVQHHTRTIYEVAGQDKLNPRCEIAVGDSNGNSLS